jgi:hypothetical protein
MCLCWEIRLPWNAIRSIRSTAVFLRQASRLLLTSAHITVNIATISEEQGTEREVVIVKGITLVTTTEIVGIPHETRIETEIILPMLPLLPLNLLYGIIREIETILRISIIVILAEIIVVILLEREEIEEMQVGTRTIIP